MAEPKSSVDALRFLLFSVTDIIARPRSSRIFSQTKGASPARGASAQNAKLQPNADPDAPGRNGIGKSQPAVTNGTQPGNTNGEHT